MKKLSLVAALLAALALVACSKPPAGPENKGAGGLSQVSIAAFRPADNGTIYVYRAGEDFRGPPMTKIGPLGPDAKAEIELPPGNYNFVLRMREEGETSGPVLEGDVKTEPLLVAVEAGKPVSVNLHGFVKKGNQKESFGQQAEYKARIAGHITDADGKAVEGIRVHAYDHVQMSERPKFVSARTGPDGKFELNLPEGGTYYLCARDKYGGPPKVGDLFGRYDKGTVEPSGVTVTDGQNLETIDITVHTVW